MDMADRGCSGVLLWGGCCGWRAEALHSPLADGEGTLLYPPTMAGGRPQPPPLARGGSAPARVSASVLAAAPRQCEARSRPPRHARGKGGGWGGREADARQWRLSPVAPGSAPPPGPRCRHKGSQLKGGEEGDGIYPLPAQYGRRRVVGEGAGSVSFFAMRWRRFLQLSGAPPRSRENGRWWPTGEGLPAGARSGQPPPRDQ